MKKPDFDALNWLRENAPGRGGTKCSICTSPEILTRVNEILRASAKTGLKVSVSKIHSHLVESFVFNYTESAVSNHLRKHVKKDGK